LKTILKELLHAISLTIAFPLALSSGFGRIESAYRFWAQSCALAPGLPGDYLRIAYYKLTLEMCSMESRIQFGSLFVHRAASMARGVYIGSYCVLGKTAIGERTQIGSGVHVLSGKQQHPRDAEGRILGSEHGIFETVRIGADCWIGSGAILMADVGSGSTIGAGAVVVHPVPPGSVAVGNPARVLEKARP
jgi:acetyltransferase-like isoleucine patch superfamily enzyme